MAPKLFSKTWTDAITFVAGAMALGISLKMLVLTFMSVHLGLGAIMFHSVCYLDWFWLAAFSSAIAAVALRSFLKHLRRENPCGNFVGKGGIIDDETG